MSSFRDPQIIYLSFMLAHRKYKTELQALTVHALNDPLEHLFIRWSVCRKSGCSTLTDQPELLTELLV